tara:strand:+ start:15 stop:203 length:189 start_codon:yes stop_codon:yes gene_type:complete
MVLGWIWSDGFGKHRGHSQQQKNDQFSRVFVPHINANWMDTSYPNNVDSSRKWMLCFVQVME